MRASTVVAEEMSPPKFGTFTATLLGMTSSCVLSTFPHSSKEGAANAPSHAPVLLQTQFASNRLPVCSISS